MLTTEEREKLVHECELKYIINNIDIPIKDISNASIDGRRYNIAINILKKSNSITEIALCKLVCIYNKETLRDILSDWKGKVMNGESIYNASVLFTIAGEIMPFREEFEPLIKRFDYKSYENFIKDIRNKYRYIRSVFEDLKCRYFDEAVWLINTDINRGEIPFENSVRTMPVIPSKTLLDDVVNINILPDNCFEIVCDYEENHKYDRFEFRNNVLTENEQCNCVVSLFIEWAYDNLHKYKDNIPDIQFIKNKKYKCEYVFDAVLSYFSPQNVPVILKHEYDFHLKTEENKELHSCEFVLFHTLYKSMFSYGNSSIVNKTLLDNGFKEGTLPYNIHNCVGFLCGELYKINKKIIECKYLYNDDKTVETLSNYYSNVSYFELPELNIINYILNKTKAEKCVNLYESKAKVFKIIDGLFCKNKIITINDLKN